MAKMCSQTGASSGNAIPPTPPLEEDEDEITIDDLRHAMAEAMKVVGSGPVKKLLATHKAARLTDLPVEAYPNVMEVCKELAAGEG